MGQYRQVVRQDVPREARRDKPRETCPETCPNLGPQTCSATCPKMCPDTCLKMCPDKCPEACSGTCPEACSDACSDAWPRMCPRRDPRRAQDVLRDVLRHVLQVLFQDELLPPSFPRRMLSGGGGDSPMHCELLITTCYRGTCPNHPGPSYSLPARQARSRRCDVQVGVRKNSSIAGHPFSCAFLRGKRMRRLMKHNILSFVA